MRRGILLAAGGLLAGTAFLGANAASAAGPSPAAARPPAAEELLGDFRLSPVSCAGGTPHGSYAVITYGTKVVANPSSGCDHGGVTLLPPGRVPLSSRGYTPTSLVGFDRGGRPLGGFTAPVAFGKHAAALVTASRDLQAGTPPTFRPPRVYLVDGRLLGDLRSVQALDGGPAGSSCLNSAGQGCWLIGRQDASGTYDPRTHRFSLDWFSGQSFTGASAGLQVHLTGVFHGTLRRVPPGAVVDLGTRSFAAGSAEPASYRGSVSRHPAHAGPGRRARGSRHRHVVRRGALASVAAVQRAGSPLAFVAGELLILLDALVLLGFGIARLGRRAA